MTMAVIQHIELGSAQAAITFSSIPNTYTDLYLVMSLRHATASTNNSILKVNGSTANLSSRRLEGAGSGGPSVSSYTDTTAFGTYAGADRTANTFANTAAYFPNYTSSAAKSWSLDGGEETNGSVAYMGIWAGLWNSTSVISSLEITPQSGNYATGSSATLYGILKGSSGGVIVS